MKTSPPPPPWNMFYRHPNFLRAGKTTKSAALDSSPIYTLLQYFSLKCGEFQSEQNVHVASLTQDAS